MAVGRYKTVASIGGFGGSGISNEATESIGKGFAERANKVHNSPPTVNDYDSYKDYDVAARIYDYREATRIAKEETDRVRGEKDVQKRRINEKQIRSLRRNYRPAGFMNNQAGETPVADKLGG